MALSSLTSGPTQDPPRGLISVESFLSGGLALTACISKRYGLSAGLSSDAPDPAGLLFLGYRCGQGHVSFDPKTLGRIPFHVRLGVDSRIFSPISVLATLRIILFPEID